MIHEYNVAGITCSSYETKIKSALLTLSNVNSIEINGNKLIITMDKHIPLSLLQKALPSKYTISPISHNEKIELTKSWINTYKPVLLIFIYLFVITFLIEFSSQNFHVIRWMRHFMAGFFLVFSFFKMLNIKGFKESYAMYDIVAKKFPTWGYIYAFIEMFLGIAFLINFNPIIVNSVTLIIMLISIIGVLQTVLNKKAIKCACLGDVFNLPMSTITIIEDGLMILMSLGMLIISC